jgi:dCTP deaminase
LESLFHIPEPSGEGILPSQEIRDFVASGKISASPAIEPGQVQPSSIDLRLSSEAYRIRASFLPGRTTTLLNKAKASGMLSKEFDISQPTLLEPGVIYVIPLMERLTLPEDVYGIANPKSTTGRLDIFTRLITEAGDEFERVRRGYKGQLFIEILSQTFPIIVQKGMRLNQLRFGRGNFAAATDAKLRGNSLVDVDEDSGQFSIERGLRITVDLQGNGSGIIAYRAKRHAPPVDLSKVGFYDIPDFWTPIRRNDQTPFILEPGEFYILASKQRIRVSPDFAAEMLPYDLATQEFRVHYAGFFDPGFGYGRAGEIPATRAVLEVRATQMPILLEDDQFVGRLNYFKMSATPEEVYGGSIGSSYQQQGLALSKQFKREDRPAAVSAKDGVSSSYTFPTSTQVSGGSVGSSQVDEDDDAAAGRLSFSDVRSEFAINAKKA